MIRNLILIAASVLVFSLSHAQAEEIIVKMKNKGADGTMMVFEPRLIHANVGDTIKFVATDPSHNAETIRGMIPDGAAPFKGKINQEIEYEITNEGVYGVKCLPHYGMGMVALIVAGEPSNLDDAQKVRHVGKAKKVFAHLFSDLKK